MKNKSFVFLLLLSLAGFFDSAYLTILHYKNVIPPCAIAKGCETVLTSRFSVFFGIPIALIGSLFFLALIFLLLL
ncbi:MAG: Vitamin K epoxide reductase, partial [Candidatus Levybacteria bacterium GW2011_GWB1_37_8]